MPGFYTSYKWNHSVCIFSVLILLFHNMFAWFIHDIICSYCWFIFFAINAWEQTLELSCPGLNHSFISFQVCGLVQITHLSVCSFYFTWNWFESVVWVRSLSYVVLPGKQALRWWLAYMWFIGKCSQEQYPESSEGSRVGERENLNCRTDVAEASIDPMNSCGAGMAFPGCLVLIDLYHQSTSIWRRAAIRERAQLWARQHLYTKGNCWGGIPMSAVS